MKNILLTISALITALSYGQDISTLIEKAEKGNAEAQFDLAFAYFEGTGVAQSYEKAVYWWRKAAEQGDAHAQLNLGNAYYQGVGVVQ